MGAGRVLFRLAEFTLSPVGREQSREGQPVALIPRYFDLLVPCRSTTTTRTILRRLARLTA